MVAVVALLAVIIGLIIWSRKRHGTRIDPEFKAKQEAKQIRAQSFSATNGEFVDTIADHAYSNQTDHFTGFMADNPLHESTVIPWEEIGYETESNGSINSSKNRQKSKPRVHSDSVIDESNRTQVVKMQYKKNVPAIVSYENMQTKPGDSVSQRSDADVNVLSLYKQSFFEPAYSDSLPVDPTYDGILPKE